jgi:hypothetical protein
MSISFFRKSSTVAEPDTFGFVGEHRVSYLSLQRDAEQSHFLCRVRTVLLTVENMPYESYFRKITPGL